MRNLTTILLTLLFIQASCQKSESTNEILKPPEVILPEGAGIDLEIDRTQIDNVINKLYKPQKDYVMIASHRGGIYWEKAPENTLAAFEKSIEYGVDIIEVDLRKTSDGHLVIMHDSDLNRVTNGSGKIIDRKLSYIKSLKTIDKDGNITDNGVPTLEETMLFVKGKALVMIDKANDYFRDVTSVLIKTKTIDHALFVEYYKFNEAKEKMGTYLFENSHYVSRIKETVNDVDGYIDLFISEKGTAAFDVRFSSETSHTLNVVPKLQDHGKSIWMNTIAPEMCAGHDDKLALSDPKMAWGWCIDKGANILLTDYPKKMANYLTDSGLH